MKEILSILMQVVDGNLPDCVDSKSGVDLNKFSELVERGYIKAIDATDDEGIAFLTPQITVSGREFIGKNSINGNSKNELTSSFDENESWKKIEDTFGLSKRSFGKKINFIENKKIRNIIFRDIAQAFSLEELGYLKPAIILAGGILEELLRNYLLSKTISINKKTLEAYIDACIENKLLEKALGDLGHYIRQMRNLVHINREIKNDTKIDRALAKIMISSIVTLSNSF